MTGNGLVQLAVYLGLLVAAVKPIGWFMAEVLEGRWPSQGGWINAIERGIYRIAGIDAAREMTWKTYTWAVLLFNGLGLGSCTRFFVFNICCR